MHICSSMLSSFYARDEPACMQYFLMSKFTIAHTCQKLLTSHQRHDVSNTEGLLLAFEHKDIIRAD